MASPARTTSPAASAATRRAIALLVVEDSDDDYLLLLARLKSGGLTVTARRVETASALQEALAGARWSAVVSDHRLPRFSSIEALAMVRAHDPDMPFLIVSGAIGEEAAVEAMRAGADDYLMKDKLSRLVPALERALDTASVRRAQRDGERALAESEERFRALSANLPGMVFQLEARDDALTLLYASDGSRRLFGMHPEELLAAPDRLWALFPDDQRAALATRFLQRARPRDAPTPGAHWLEYTAELGGSEPEAMRWIQFTARARHVAERVVWDGIASDITAEKRAERALRASREELRELASYFARVREEERTSVARELHDDVGSTLTGIKFQLAAIRTKLAQDDALGARVAHLDDLVDGVIGSTSRLMHDLRPGILDEGIVAALEWQARTFEQRTGLPCEFAASHEDIALPPEAAMAAFRICQEALNNVVKHAAAASVEVQLCRRGDALTLTIADDGIGIDEEARRKPGHFGLRGMRERALAFGGTVDVARPAEGGTAITLTLPLASEPLPAGAQEVLP